MDSKEEPGLFLNLDECKCLFNKLKKDENGLTDCESYILQRLEKMLYSRLSIKEIEVL